MTQLNILFLLAVIALTACTPVSTPTTTATSTTTSVSTRTSTYTGVIGPGCPAKGAAQAVDLSMPVDQRFLDVVRSLGIKTIIRYGDYVNETIRGKTPKAAERKLIKDNGFTFLAVFQHNNSSIRSFTKERGKADALRMKELYPEAPAFYFGVDGEFHLASEQASVKTYAVEFSKVTRDLGKKVGAYGSGLTCKNLMAAGLIDYCWLANATGWSGTKEFAATGKWSLRQGLPKKCGGKEGDFNVVNTPSFGQW